jgi:hypothetical protein
LFLLSPLLSIYVYTVIVGGGVVGVVGQRKR